jgi:hypothetical protein
VCGTRAKFHSFFANQSPPKRFLLAVMGRNEGKVMKKISTLAAVLLVGTVVAAYAQESPGASEYSPGDRMHDQRSNQNRENSPGASQYAPGHEQKTPGGASEMSPGDRMNDTRGQGGR